MTPTVRHILFYDYVPDIVDRRGPHREQHLALARRWKDEGRLAAAGALGEPPHGAAFVFELADAAPIDEYVAADPYVAAGLVTAWRVERWNVVI